ncbi:MAG: ABC transporter substrate-binding protein [Oscillospiraceae bacterium]|nr:ABC transporter substrate-binding protein [Oscillospiraceae bacterium]
MKKLTILTAVILITAMFTSCAGPGSSTSQTPNTATQVQAQVTTTEEPGLPPVTLRFFYRGDELPMVQDVWRHMEDVTRDRLNAEFEITFVPALDYNNKMTVLTTSGDDFDMAFDADWVIYPVLSQRGAYLDVSELLPKYAPIYWKELQDMGVDASVRTAKGEIYGMPWTVLINDHPFLHAHLDRYALTREHVDELGLENDSIKTFEDMDDLFQKLKVLLPEGTHIFEGEKTEIYGPMAIISCTGTDYVNMWSAFYSYVFNIKDYESTGKITLEPIERTACFYEAVKWATKWVKEEIMPGDLLNNIDVHRAEPADKKAIEHTPIEGIYTRGVALGGEWSLPNRGEVTNLWTSELYPDQGYMRKPPLANLYVINANAKNPERTIMFIELAGSDKEIYDIYQYGIEGKTYIKDQETGFYDHPEGSSAASPLYMNWQSRWSLWRPHMFAPSPEKPDQYWRDVEEYAKGPGEFINPLDSFVPDIESVKNEIAIRTSLINEMGRPLTYGMVTDGVDAIPAYIDQQTNDGGADIILAELQKQVDEYMAAKSGN